VSTTSERLQGALTWLEREGSARTIEENLTRYAIDPPKSYGVPMAKMQKLAKQLGTDHALADALWKSGWYEAQSVAALIDDPELVTAAQMERWAKAWDNWAICDTVCFKLFDRAPHAYAKAEQWCGKRAEYVKRGGFVMIACLALHDKKAGDEWFLKSLGLIEGGATDERNFVKKGVSWALRSIGHRNNKLKTASLSLAKELIASESPSAKWIGRETVRDLSRPAAKKRR
jgi:3-methyladenine DNA glycosylase AlkD